MAEKQVYSLQLLTFLINKYDYQIVNIRGLKTEDYWLVNLKQPYPLICITQEKLDRDLMNTGMFATVYRALMGTFSTTVKCLVLNTSSNGVNFEVNNITHYSIQEDHVDSSLLQKFPGIDQVVKTVENVEVEKRKLTKVLQKKAKSEFISQLKKNDMMPNVTMMIAAICVVMFIVQFALTFITKDVMTSAILSGAYYKMNVLAAHEYWRLLTSGFVHANIWHLLMNLMAFFNLGMVLEGRLKKKRYLITLLVSIVVGNLFVLMGDANVVGIGLSGGLFGLLGVYTVMLFTEGYYKNPRVLSSFMTTMCMNFLISLLPNISMLAHLGGFISGIVFGIYFSDKKLLEGIKGHVMNAFGAVIIGCVLTSAMVGQVMPITAYTDANVIRSVRNLHLDFYADYLVDRYDAQVAKQGQDGYKEFLDTFKR